MMELDALKTGFHYCMHGLGAFAGVRQTNTKEAFYRWYKKGIKCFEFDIGKTADNKYVAVAHTVDKKSMRRMEVFEEPKEYTESWFMSQTLFSLSTKGLTPMSLNDIIKLLIKHEDIVVMLDLFGLFEKTEILDFLAALSDSIGDNKTIKERLLVESYSLEAAGFIAQHDYRGIYCARHEYNTAEINIAETISFLKANNVLFISYPFMYNESFKGELENYSKNGLTVFSRTKYNNKQKELSSYGVTVNIVSFVFDKKLFLFQYMAYMCACFRRLLAKIYVKIKY